MALPAILIVDDDVAWRGLLAHALETAGYVVHQADDGVGAVQLCQEHRPALVITDIFMPERDGLEVLEAIKRMDYRPRVLAMSGSTTESVDFLKIATRLGADRALRKPFSADALRAAVRELIGDPVP